MNMLMAMLTMISVLPDAFLPVGGFSDLDLTATPTRFGILLVAGDDSCANLSMANMILDAVDSLPDSAETDLFVITSDGYGYSEIASLCSDYPGFPAVMIMVGHCGYIQLDTDFLTAEIVDSWYTWGNPGTRKTGICNFCRRCNP